MGVMLWCWRRFAMSEESSEMSVNSLVSLDRRFTITAIVIGLSYVLIIAGIGLVFGRETAGIAALALTALATGVFKKFEDLQFKKSPRATIEVPTFGIWLLFLLVLSFSGAVFIFVTLVGLAANVVGFTTGKTAPSTEVELLLNLNFLISILGAKALAYFATAYCAARVIKNLRYSQVLIAGLLALILDALIPIVLISLSSLKAGADLLLDPSTYSFSIYWIVVLGGVLLGTKFASREDVS